MEGEAVIIEYLELAGWGGGPGMQFSRWFKGTMIVAPDAQLPGLLVATVEAGSVEVDEYTAKVMGATERRLQGSFPSERTRYFLGHGTCIRFAPNHVRLIQDA
jgi:hypothetical protein